MSDERERDDRRYEFWASNIHDHLLRRFTGKALRIVNEDVNDCFHIRYELGLDSGEVISIRIQKEAADGSVVGPPWKGAELNRGKELPDTEMSEKERARYDRWRG